MNVVLFVSSQLIHPGVERRPISSWCTLSLAADSWLTSQEWHRWFTRLTPFYGPWFWKRTLATNRKAFVVTVNVSYVIWVTRVSRLHFSLLTAHFSFLISWLWLTCYHCHCQVFSSHYWSDIHHPHSPFPIQWMILVLVKGGSIGSM